MAWQGRFGPARSWVVAVVGTVMGAGVGAGCTDTNPAYGGGGDTAAQGESTSQGPTTMPDGTSTTEDASAGTVAGTCEEAQPGSEVFVGPTAGVPQDLCGSGYAGIGMLRFTGTAYQLYPGQPCLVDGEPIILDFVPKGPNWSINTESCVQYEVSYRPDCSFDRAIIRDLDEGLVFAAGTEVTSHVSELELEHHPRGDVCDCDSAQCCPNAPPPGVYFLRATFGGETFDVDQESEKHTFDTADGMFELEVSQARVVDDCSDPRQFDWHFRRLGTQ